MSQYFKGSGPFDFFGPLGAYLLNFFGNIARARAARLVRAPLGALGCTGEIIPGAGPPPPPPPMAPRRENLMDLRCFVR